MTCTPKVTQPAPPYSPSRGLRALRERASEASAYLRWPDQHHAEVLAQLGALRGLVSTLTAAVRQSGGLAQERAAAAAEAVVVAVIALYR